MNAVAGMHAGVKLERVKPEVLREELAAVGIKVDADVGPKMLVEKLYLHYKAERAKLRFSKCSTCGGVSDTTLKRCPYCGDAEQVVTAASDARAVPQVQEKIAAVVEQAKPEIEASKALALNQRVPLAQRDQGGKQLPLRDRKPVNELEVQCRVIANLTRTAAVNLHSIGVALTIINQGELWKQRRAGDKQKFTSFAAFVLDEFGMTKQYAYQLIAIAKEFDPKTISEIGPHKLRLALQVQGEQREQVIKEAKQNRVTVQQVQEHVQRLKGGVDKRREPQKITVGVVPGMVRVPLHKRDKKKHTTQQASLSDTGKHKPAKSLADDPFGRLRLSNDVVMIFKLMRNRNDELVLAVETRRARDEI